MNQELAGGTLGMRAAENVIHRPEEWRTVNTSSGVYQVNRYTGAVKKLDIPVNKPTTSKAPKLTQGTNYYWAWDKEKGQMVKTNVPTPRSGKKAGKQERPVTKEWYDSNGNKRYASVLPSELANFSDGVISAGGSLAKPVTKTNAAPSGFKNPINEVKTLVASGVPEEEATVIVLNERKPSTSTELALPGGETLRLNQVYNPKKGTYQQVTLGDLRAVVNSGRAPNILKAYELLIRAGQSADPVAARSNIMPITAFGGQ